MMRKLIILAALAMLLTKNANASSSLSHASSIKIKSNDDLKIKESIKVSTKDEVDKEVVKQFFEAIHYEHSAQLKKLIGANPNLANARNSEDMTALYFAAKRRNYNACDILLKAGAEIEDLSPNTDYVLSTKESPLHVAARLNSMELINMLLPFIKNVDLKDLNGQTALMHASRGKSHLAIEVLLRKGANPNITFRGRSALFEAVHRRNLKIVQLLLLAGASPDLLETDGSDGMRTSIHNAIEYEYFEILPLLLSNSVDVDQPNSKGETALMIAAKKNSVDPLLMLLRHQANINRTEEKSSWAAIDFAISYGMYNNIQLLLERGASIDRKIKVRSGNNEYTEMTPLMLSMASTYNNIFFLLLERSSFVNDRDSSGNTILLRAVAAENEGAIQQLLQKGADPNIAHGYTTVTPLFEAVSYDYFFIARNLVEAGAEVDTLVTDKSISVTFQQTVLHKAIRKRNMDFLKLFVNKTKKIDQPDSDGATALSIALRSGFSEGALHLIRNGAQDSLVESGSEF